MQASKAKCCSKKEKESKVKKRKLNGHSVNLSASQSVKLSLSDSVKQSTLQQQRQSLLISVNQISAGVWLFAACCHSLFPNTTAYFSVHSSDGRHGDRKKRQAYTLSRVHQSNSGVLHYRQKLKAVWRPYKDSAGMNFKKVLILRCIFLQENRPLPDFTSKEELLENH